MNEGGRPAAGRPDAGAESGGKTGEKVSANAVAQAILQHAASPEREARHEPDRTGPDSGDAQAQRDRGRLAHWLSAAGAPEAMTARIADALGDGAAEQVAADPWCVLEVPGIAPQAADALARVVVEGAEPGDPRRTRALVSWLLRRAAAVGGHTVQGADTIAEALGRFGVTDATGAIADAIEHGAALAFAEPRSLPEDADESEVEDFERLDAEDDDDPVSMLTSARTLLAAERWAFAEQAAAEAAQRLAATPDAVESKQGPESVDALVAAVAQHGLTLVTGADAQRVADLAESFPSALLTCPSAAGLRTLAAVGADAVDARLLAQDPRRAGEVDVLLIADAQLLGLEAGTALLEAARDGAHVVLAGDPATPGAAGPGQFFRDLLETTDPGFGGRLPRVELKRRPTGPLSALADAVRHGGLPPQDLLQGADGTSKEVVIVPVREAGEAVHRAVQVAVDSIPRAFGFGGRQVQVVAVEAEGAAGAGALNAALKARLNPGPGLCGGFDAGDRIVVGAPLPERGLFGGETGTVSAATAGVLTIAWDAPHAGRERPGQNGTPEQRSTEPVDDGAAESAHPVAVTDPAGAADEFTAAQCAALRPAWALTVAEAQAGRWPAVVAVFDGGSAPKLTRALALGAITLATEHLTVVHGAGRALADAVEKIPDRPRRTRLRHALRD